MNVNDHLSVSYFLELCSVFSVKIVLKIAAPTKIRSSFPCARLCFSCPCPRFDGKTTDKAKYAKPEFKNPLAHLSTIAKRAKALNTSR